MKNIHWLILAGVPIDDTGGGQRPAQLARFLLDRGYKVTYVYVFDTSEKVSINVDFNYSLFNSFSLDNFNPHSLIGGIKDKLNILVEFPHPSFLEILKKLRNIASCIIYERIDPWETSLGYGWYSEYTENQICLLSDHLTATAVSLLDELVFRTRRPVSLLPNAYNNKIFNKDITYEKPLDIPNGPTIGYVGSLWGTWFDFDLVCSVANSYPYCNIIIVGDYHNQFDEIKPHNIHFIGLKAQTDLPAYLAHFRVALIPFKVDNLTTGVNPLKIYEYLAMGLTVVSTPLPEVINFPYVLIGSTTESFVKNVGIGLTQPKQNIYLDYWLNNNSWEARIEKLIQLSNNTLKL